MTTMNELFQNMKDILTKLKKIDPSIKTVNDFALLTDTIAKREELSKKLEIPQFQIYHVAKLANLLQCTELSVENAEFLIKTGVRSINDLKKLDIEKYTAFIENIGYVGKSDEPDKSMIDDWVYSALNISTEFETDIADIPNSSYMYSPSVKDLRISSNRTPSTNIGIDLADIITELGVGLANAQRALDQNSIEMQKQILNDAQLRAYGLNATWFAIPETTFSLKMEYAFSEEQIPNINSGQPRFPRMRIIPANATYKNTYNSSGSTESTLNLRIVPIPAPEKIAENVIVPNLVGMELEEAEDILGRLGLFYKLNLVHDITPHNDKTTEILNVSKLDGTVIFSQNDKATPSSHELVMYTDLILDYAQQIRETESQNSLYLLELTDPGESKMDIIKLIREIAGLTLKESKTTVENTPVVLFDNLNAADAEAYASKFSEKGATVIIREVK